LSLLINLSEKRSNYSTSDTIYRLDSPNQTNLNDE